LIWTKTIIHLIYQVSDKSRPDNEEKDT